MPLIILIAIAVPATGTLLDLEDAKTDADITLQVTGIQWKWKYTYIDDDVSFISSLAQSSRDVISDPTGNENYLLEVDQPVVLPINKKSASCFTPTMSFTPGGSPNSRSSRIRFPASSMIPGR